MWFYCEENFLFLETFQPLVFILKTIIVFGNIFYFSKRNDSTQSQNESQINQNKTKVLQTH